MWCGIYLPNTHKSTTKQPTQPHHPSIYPVRSNRIQQEVNCAVRRGGSRESRRRGSRRRNEHRLCFLFLPPLLPHSMDDGTVYGMDELKYRSLAFISLWIYWQTSDAGRMSEWVGSGPGGNSSSSCEMKLWYMFRVAAEEAEFATGKGRHGAAVAEKSWTRRRIRSTCIEFER